MRVCPAYNCPVVVVMKVGSRCWMTCCKQRRDQFATDLYIYIQRNVAEIHLEEEIEFQNRGVRFIIILRNDGSIVKILHIYIYM